MRQLNKKASKILDALTLNLDEPGSYRKIDNSEGTYMAVHVNCIAPRLFNVAHHFIQNGDVMDDPSMDFFKAPSGLWFPCSYTIHSLGLYQVSMEATPRSDGTFEYKLRRRLQREHAIFAGTWMANIRQQQTTLQATAA